MDFGANTLIQFGMCGLLFYMWWTDAREKHEVIELVKNTLTALNRSHERETEFVAVIRDNTRTAQELCDIQHVLAGQVANWNRRPCLFEEKATNG